MSKRPGGERLAPPSKRLSRSPSPVEPYHTGVILTSAVEAAITRRMPETPLEPRMISLTLAPASTDIPQHAGPAVSDPSASNLCLGTVATGNAVPKCFRIANVPLDWNEDMLLVALKVIDPFLERQNPQLSLYPACCGATQTALLNLDVCSGYFRGIEPNVSYCRQASDGTFLDIDSHFYGLTQLNAPEGNIVADVVAVTGLAGHAFGSWRSRETRQMWLKDFLPKDFKNVRIMTYGYDSSVIGPERNDATLTDYRRSFIEELDNSRSSVKNRPIIFHGHSLGGILVLQALIESKRNLRQQSILDSTHGIFFFGTPYQGLRTDELEEVIDTNSRQRHQLIAQLKEGSEFLENQKEDLLPIFRRLIERKVVNFYETVKTPSVRMLDSGEIRRDGPEVQMVGRFSAQLFLSFECRVPVNKNHTDMVKFPTSADSTYQTVVKHMKECIAGFATVDILWRAIELMTPDQFLQKLSAIDQEKYRNQIPDLDFHQPKFYWIFKNMDFSRWNTVGCSQILWICGPPECRIREVSSHIVALARKASAIEYTVLYFFCSTAVGKNSVATTFVRALFQQAIFGFPLQEQKTMIAIFFRTLIGTRSGTDLKILFEAQDSLDEKVREVLDSSGGEHWNALRAVFDIRPKTELSVILDGLDKIEHQRNEFIKEVIAFIEHLQERSWTVRALFTCRPQADIKGIFGGLPCIEYDKERKECLNTLRFDNTRYGKIEEEHEGSLQWLWEHEKYQAWSSANSSDLLLIEGKPGSGKSTLAKYFKNNLLERDPLARQAIVGSFFYSYREGELQTDHSSMLRSILYDILHHNETFFFHFQSYYRQALQSGTNFQWPYNSLKRILASLGDHPVAERIFLIVDAIDESNDEDRRKIVQMLGQICSTKKACIVKIFLASRPTPELNHSTLRDHKIIKLQDANNPDISKFAEGFLGSDLDLSPEIRLQATDYIVKNAQGVFIWVRLVKEELIKCAERGYNKKRIFDYLKSLPTELEEFYERILNGLNEREELDITDGLKMFRLVIFARRPLKLEEIRQALAIPDDPKVEFSPSDESFEEELIQGIDKRIIHCGGNLLEMKIFHGNSSVQVMHQTVREFFLQPNGPIAKSKFSMSHEESQVRISILCIRYLLLCAANTTLATELPPTELWTSENFEDYARYLNKRPFISYASSHLKQHMQSCGDSRSMLSRFCRQLFAQPADSPASYLLESWSARQPTDSAKDFRNRLLHTASGMQISEVVETLMIAGAEVEVYQGGKTPLMVSAETGDEATARVLLARGAYIGARDNQYQTALHLAAANGHDGMIKLLVNRGAPKEARDKQDRTALHHATHKKHANIVRLLVALGLDIEAKDHDGKNVLHLAAQDGNDTIVRLLAETFGAKQEVRVVSGQTTLRYAAEGGHDTTVRRQVETFPSRLVNKDNLARTALHLAAARGHDTTVQLLVETFGAETEARDNCERTALLLAAESGHDATVQLLVETFGAEMETRDNCERTALLLAAESGHDATVQLLVRTLGANLQIRGRGMQGVLHLAAAGGHDSTVQLLVETFGANMQITDHIGRTPLHLAAAGGHDSTVQLLVETLGANMRIIDHIGGTPLHLAAAGGHYSTVKVLAQNSGRNVDTMDRYGRTAMHSAAGAGHDSTVQLLVETFGANKQITDYDERTALHLAATGGHHSTAQLLVETFGANVQIRDHNGRTALHLAAAAGHDSTVQLLVETLGANMRITDNIGETPLHLAAAGGHYSTVKVLAQKFGGNVDTMDQYGRTARQLAAAGGHHSTAQLLVETSGANMGIRDNCG